jgi:hypothetical protein
MLFRNSTQDENHEPQAFVHAQRDLANRKATCSHGLLRCRIAVARQDLGGTADALSKGVIERDPATLPSM